MLAVLALMGATTAASADTGALSVTLSVSNSNPRQRQGVTLFASASGGAGIVGYQFSYGDGVVENTYQTVMSHGYGAPGTYQATVTVADANGQTATSSPVTVTVRDGIPPTVRITSPRPGGHVHLGRSGFAITGTANDPGPGASGVSRVQLALELVSVPPGIGACPWYNGKQSFLLRSCGNPAFFTAKMHSGHFSFHLNPHLGWIRGVYALRVRGVDRAGNVSDFFAVKLRTILGFRLSR
jgi:hypothetical protein